jgi:hypothetical protein
VIKKVVVYQPVVYEPVYDVTPIYEPKHQPVYESEYGALPAFMTTAIYLTTGPKLPGKPFASIFINKFLLRALTS